MSKWRDAQHLIRPAAVFLVGTALFLAARRVVIPPSFGQYGHYRGAVLAELREQPVKYAGGMVCAGCHPDVVEARDKDKHAGIRCEACHGPLAKHTEDPSAVKPAKPDPTPLCVRCHEADSAKPPSFPQVRTREHSGGERCESCHSPHNPKP